MRGNEIINGTKLRVYDDGGKSIDRYTVAFTGSHHHASDYGCGNPKCGRCYDKLYDMVAMGRDVTSPQGFYQHSDCLLGKHLGKRIPFSSLPPEHQQRIINETLEMPPEA